jgi:hypothetical protein
MPSSGMLHCVALVRTDIWEECIVSIIRMTKIGEIGTSLAVTSNRNTLRKLVTANVFLSSPILVNLLMEAISSSEISVLKKITQRNIPEDDILRSHRRENLKSCRALPD